MITMIVGAMLLPMPRDAAIVQSMNALTAYDQPIIEIRCIPASTTAGSFVKSERNCLPKIRRSPPKNAPAAKEYDILIK